MIVPIPSYERDVERTFNPVATVLDKMGVKYVNILEQIYAQNNLN